MPSDVEVRALGEFARALREAALGWVDSCEAPKLGLTVHDSIAAVPVDDARLRTIAGLLAYEIASLEEVRRALHGVERGLLELDEQVLCTIALLETLDGYDEIMTRAQLVSASIKAALERTGNARLASPRRRATHPEQGDVEKY